MGKRTGTVTAIDDGVTSVRILAGGAPRLVHVPQQVLPDAAIGDSVAVEVADWELDSRVLLVCLPPVLLALAGAIVLDSVIGVAAGMAVGTLMAWLSTRETHHGGAPFAPRRSLRSIATQK